MRISVQTVAGPSLLRCKWFIGGYYPREKKDNFDEFLAILDLSTGLADCFGEVGFSNDSWNPQWIMGLVQIYSKLECVQAVKLVSSLPTTWSWAATKSENRDKPEAVVSQNPRTTCFSCSPWSRSLIVPISSWSMEPIVASTYKITLNCISCFYFYFYCSHSLYRSILQSAAVPYIREDVLNMSGTLSTLRVLFFHGSTKRNTKRKQYVSTQPLYSLPNPNTSLHIQLSMPLKGNFPIYNASCWQKCPVYCDL